MDRSQIRQATALALMLMLACAGLADGQTPQAPVTRMEKMQANGTFDVKMAPQGSGDAVEGTALGKMTLDKTFQGDLEGTGKGEMLTAMTPVKDSAGYVAIERITGKLKGLAGSFMLQHTGTMTRGAPSLVITVVPDSGTGELAGLAGTMTIKIEAGKHFYEMAYTLPAKP
jgi:uncharacterized protein DUF3224